MEHSEDTTVGAQGAETQPPENVLTAEDRRCRKCLDELLPHEPGPWCSWCGAQKRLALARKRRIQATPWRRHRA